MPGREDFAIIRARLFGDERADRAAEIYIEEGIATEETAFAAVVGHIAMLGVWTSRETDNGVMPGDGMTAIRAAIPTDRRTRSVIRNAFLAAGLMRDRMRSGKRVGTYLVGFTECYRPILDKRKKDAERQRKRRNSLKTSHVTSQGTSRVTSALRPNAPDRTGPDRTEEETPTPSRGKEIAPLRDLNANRRYAENRPDKPLRPRARERLERVLEYVIRCGTTHPDAPDRKSQSVALERRRAYRAGSVSDDKIREWLKDYEWVTSDKLARRMEGTA